MTNAILTDLRLTSRCTYSALSEAADMPATRLKRYQPSENWRATDPTKVQVDVDLGTGISDLGLPGYNFFWLGYARPTTAATTFQIWTATTAKNLDTSPAWTSGVLPFWRSPDCGSYDRVHSFVYLDTPRLEQFVRLGISPDPAATFQDLGIFAIEYAFVPRLNIQPMPGSTLTQESRIFEASGGAQWAQVRPIRRQGRFRMQATGAGARTEMKGELEALQGRVGVARPVISILNPDDGHYSMSHHIYGRLTELAEIPMADAWELSEAQFTVLELL
jgi:hypothetical protein